MYYICNFFENWSIYNKVTKTSEPLKQIEIDLIKKLFPDDLSDKDQILDALQVSKIEPNKLLKITKTEKLKTGKKANASTLKTI